MTSSTEHWIAIEMKCSITIQGATEKLSIREIYIQRQIEIVWGIYRHGSWANWRHQDHNSIILGQCFLLLAFYLKWEPSLSVWQPYSFYVSVSVFRFSTVKESQWLHLTLIHMDEVAGWMIWLNGSKQWSRTVSVGKRVVNECKNERYVYRRMRIVNYEMLSSI